MKLADALAAFLASPGLQPAAGLHLLTRYFGPDARLDDVPPLRLRDFLGRWVAEEAAAASPPLDIPALLDHLEQFIRWAAADAECLTVIREMKVTLPRALEIAAALSAERARGAFAFPEFLTSFEEGGRSQYDLDAPGEAGSLEGYFRVTRVAGLSVEAEELISEAVVWPITFPEKVARLLAPGYVLNLEVVRAAGGWRVADSGFVYPPGTDLTP